MSGFSKRQFRAEILVTHEAYSRWCSLSIKKTQNVIRFLSIGWKLCPRASNQFIPSNSSPKLVKNPKLTRGKTEWHEWPSGKPVSRPSRIFRPSPGLPKEILSNAKHHFRIDTANLTNTHLHFNNVNKMECVLFAMGCRESKLERDKTKKLI